MSIEGFSSDRINKRRINIETGRAREKRNRIFKAGIASYQNHNLTVDCVIRDLNPKSARLKFEKGGLVPEQFMLTIPMDGVKVDCEVKWRKGLELGVAFVSKVQPDTRNVRRQSVDIKYMMAGNSAFQKTSRSIQIASNPCEIW